MSKHPLFKAKVSMMNPEDWIMDGWSEDVAEILRKSDFCEKIAAKIAREAVESFFEEGVVSVVTKDGIRLSNESGDQSVTIPWNLLLIDKYDNQAKAFEAAEAMRVWLKDELAEFEGDGDVQS